MKPSSRLTAMALSGMVAAFPLLVGPSFAGTAKPATATPVQAAQDMAAKQEVKAMAEALAAIKSVHAARLAIFNGDTQMAEKSVVAAGEDLKTAMAGAGEFAMKTSRSTGGDEVFLPFDSNISLVEGFKPTEEKQPVIAKANAHLAAGESQKAVETLKAANIEVTISAAMLPLQTSVTHVADAERLVKEGRYYEANLALKAVEDSVFVEAFSVDGVPVQGS